MSGPVTFICVAQMNEVIRRRAG